MPKYFPVTSVITQVIQIPVNNQEVDSEKLTYDNRTTNKKSQETAVAAAISQEFGKKAIETVTAAFAAEITEVNRKSFEDVNNQVIAVLLDSSKKSSETTSVDIQDLTINKKSNEAVSSDLLVLELQKKSLEDINNTVSTNVLETGKKATEQIQSAIIAQTELNQKSADTQVIEVTLNGYSNQNVQNTGWTNQGNILGNTTNTSASLTATSSGLAGTTNNTTNGTTSVAFRDINLGDLEITSVVINAENSGASTGVPIVQPTVNIQYQYSLNNGSTWTTFYNHTTTNLAKGVRSLDITSIVGQDQSLINSLQVRATGSVTSGTGLGAGYTASFFRTWVTILANKVYT